MGRISYLERQRRMAERALESEQASVEAAAAPVEADECCDGLCVDCDRETASE